MQIICGIYKITNLINTKCYIGQSVNIYDRWLKHKRCIRDYPLYRAFAKYGIENFQFSIIEECSRDLLNEREIYWIKFYDSFKNGYNQNYGGNQNIFPGQKLNWEIVDEIKLMLEHSQISIKEIAEKFKVSRDTIDRINHGTTYYDSSMKYPIRPRYFQVVKPKQDKNISSTKKRISICPDPVTLENDIKALGFTGTGRKYGVSGNAVIKWCFKLKMPTSIYYYRPKKSKISKQSKSLFRAVLKIDKKTDTVLATYSSISDAARALGNINFNQHIQGCCAGKRKSAYGFVWKYLIAE